MPCNLYLTLCLNLGPGHLGKLINQRKHLILEAGNDTFLGVDDLHNNADLGLRAPGRTTEKIIAVGTNSLERPVLRQFKEKAELLVPEGLV